MISPCVTFNDHEGSTKSYKFMREHEVKEVADRLRARCTCPIREKIPRDDAKAVTMHDGSVLRFRSVPEGYDPSDRLKVEEYIRDRHAARRDRDRPALPRRDRPRDARAQPDAHDRARRRALREALPRR